MAGSEAFACPFPAASKQASGLVASVPTEITLLSFADKIVMTVSQAGKLAHWVHVPLASTAGDTLMRPMGARHDHGDGDPDGDNSLLPMSHLTATTVLGGTRRDDEVVGQTLATTIGSAILMQRPAEARMLVLGIGLDGGMAAQFAASDGRAHYDELIGLVLQVL